MSNSLSPEEKTEDVKEILNVPQHTSHDLVIISWNVDGWKPDVHWTHVEELITIHHPTILCLQETKCREIIFRKSIKDKARVLGYSIRFNVHTPAGWHGIAVLIHDASQCGHEWECPNIKLECKMRSDNKGVGAADGRLIVLDHKTRHLRLVLTYVPNAGRDLKHLRYRVDEWNRALYKLLQSSDRETIWMGDLNITPTITKRDMSDPKMKRWAGGTKEEQESHRAFLQETKWVDIWRHQHPNETAYSWRGKNRDGMYGLRLDHSIVSPNLLGWVSKSWIDIKHKGPSDHVPIGLVLSFPHMAEAIKKSRSKVTI